MMENDLKGGREAPGALAGAPTLPTPSLTGFQEPDFSWMLLRR